jgi:hypothetical protein
MANMMFFADYAIAMIVIGAVAVAMITLAIINYKCHIYDCNRRCCCVNDAEVTG